MNLTPFLAAQIATGLQIVALPHVNRVVGAGRMTVAKCGMSPTATSGPHAQMETHMIGTLMVVMCA